jgi:hypothetical protein
MTKEEKISILKDIIDGEIIHPQIRKYVGILAIQALEQDSKTGHWIDDMSLGYHVSICSNCDWRGHGDTCLIYKPKYCPNCGAKMIDS